MRVLLAVVLIGATTHAFSFSKTEILQAKKSMIENSISNYSGNCPCPYNTMRNGRSCGKRSAYSRPGGESPICYPEDITDQSAINFLKK